MENTKLLILAMVERCRSIIEKSTPNFQEPTPPPGPRHLEYGHLIWMCDRIEENADDWPLTKLHRWIGFIQAGMLANRMLSMDEIRDMFNDAKSAYGSGVEDRDLIDHLDPECDFRFDLGGEA